MEITAKLLQKRRSTHGLARAYLSLSALASPLFSFSASQLTVSSPSFFIFISSFFIHHLRLRRRAHLRFSPPVQLLLKQKTTETTYKNNLSLERGPTRPRLNSRSHKGNEAMIPDDCRGKGKGVAMRGSVDPRTSFSCCIQVVSVVFKILSCA